MATGLFAPLFKLTDVQNPFVQLMQGFSGDFVRKNPVAVRKFMEDFATVANYVNNPANRSAVIATTAAISKMETAVLDKFLLTNDDYYRPAHGAVDVAALQKNWDFFRQEGGITKPLRVSEYARSFA
jgi:ABC-type nitrate/sulfonate/bicarbonate transport system substrate-binding protein